MVLADCIATKLLRYSCFPISSLLLDKLKIIVAPCKAWESLGGVTVHKSSQISIAKVISFSVLSWNNKFVEIGTSWPNNSTSFVFKSLLEENHLAS